MGDAAYQQYVRRVVKASLNQGLIGYSTPGDRNSRKEAACNIFENNLVTYSCVSLDYNKVPVNAHATAHVSQDIPKISTHISTVWDEHSDWAIIRDSLVKGAAETAKCGLPME